MGSMVPVTGEGVETTIKQVSRQIALLMAPISASNARLTGNLTTRIPKIFPASQNPILTFSATIISGFLMPALYARLR